MKVFNLKKISGLASIALILFCQTSYGAKSTTARSKWLGIDNPMQQPPQSRLWVYRPTQTNGIEYVEKYQPNLPNEIRINAYCKGMETHFKQKPTRVNGEGFCALSGISVQNEYIFESAVVKNDLELRHFVIPEPNRTPASFKDFVELSKSHSKEGKR